MGYAKTLEEIFKKTIVKPNGCIEWTGGGTKDGYGQTYHNGKHYLVHRLVLILSGVDIPENYLVLHTCDNPPCCNPEHLFIGTHLDNILDAIKKGRWNRERELKPPKTISRRVRLGLCKHGTITTYGLGCRCEACIAEMRRQAKSKRE